MRVITILLLIVYSTWANSIHKIERFPGAPENFNVSAFSGYLNVTDEEHQMFYLLVDSQSSPSTDPLIIWLQGGPGASGLYGAFIEIGPFIVDSRGEKLLPNSGAWNGKANLLFLESPIGVGFSVGSTNISDDNETAEQHYRAIYNFITEVRPDFANRTFYIAGESYAGVFIPFVSRLILNRTREGTFENRNFKGILIGNGYFDIYYSILSANLKMLTDGFVGDDPKLILECMISLERNNTPAHELNAKGLPKECDPVLKAMAGHSDRLQVGFGAKHRMAGFNQGCYDDNSSHILTNGGTGNEIFDARMNLPCHFEYALQTYLNRPDVRKALNIREDVEPYEWLMVSERVAKEYTRTQNSIPIFIDVIRLAQESGLPFRIHFYTGDQDLLCPILETYRAAKTISAATDMNMAESKSYWYYKGDVGGAHYYYRNQDESVTLKVLSVRGAGHSVPLSHPDVALRIFEDFVSNRPNQCARILFYCSV